VDFDQKNEDAAAADYEKYQQQMEEDKPVVLVTAHKSKGLEFSRVFILRYDQFPHPRAKRTGIPEDLQQEANAKFVALSRGMDETHILDPEGQPGYQAPNEREMMDAEPEPDPRFLGPAFDPRQLWSRYVENRQNQERWQRRKAKHHKDQKHGKQGQIAGNPRYSGKRGWGSTQQPNNFRTKNKEDQ
jgi:superfamily I DNA/RNA helicase